jgi:hypothetical protein
MNWFWLRSRRASSAGALPHRSEGRLAGRILCVWLSVVIAEAVAGCTGSPGGAGQGIAWRCETRYRGSFCYK